MSGERIEVRIEDPGDQEEIEVIELKVAEGASVQEGELLLEIATDKANMEIFAPAAGVVDELHVAEGDIVASNIVLMVLRT